MMVLILGRLLLPIAIGTAVTLVLTVMFLSGAFEVMLLHLLAQFNQYPVGGFGVQKTN